MFAGFSAVSGMMVCPRFHAVLDCPYICPGTAIRGAWDKTFVPAFITPEMAFITLSEPILMLLGYCIRVSQFASSVG